MCFDKPFQQPEPLTKKSRWFGGFFDGDGTLGYTFKNGWPQLVISVSNKFETDCYPFKQMFGGTIRLDKASNTYKWEIYSKDQLQTFAI